MSRLTRRTRAVLAATASVAIAGALAPGATAITPQTPAPAVAAPAAASSLIISEYVEGSSSNKALEIYNGTGAAVDLSGYVLQGYQNANTEVGYNIDLEGSLAPGDVHVVAHGSSTAELLAVADQVATLQFNGDDTVVLRTSAGETLDSIGQVAGEKVWGSGDVTTQNDTLRRMAEVCAGDTDPTDAYDPTIEWVGFPMDTFDGLGEHTANCGAVEPLTPVINEISVNNTGTDIEFLEVYGEPDTDYSDLSIVQIKADKPHTETGQLLTVHQVGSTDADGFWSVDLPANALQNGSISLLLVSGNTGQAGTVVDTDSDGVIDTPAWEAVLDSVAILDGDAGDLAYSGTILAPGFRGDTNQVGGASRIPDGADTDTAADWVRNDFNLAGFPDQTGTPTPGQAWNTPGEPNAVYEEEPPPPGGACDDPATAIGAVQGSGDSTPMSGDVVTIEGVVVGDLQSGGFNGFYVQDGGDDDPATSDGIFVYAPGAAEVAVGDQVRVTGTAAEFDGLTQVSGTPTIQACATGVELPEATVLAFPMTDADKEAVEGMRVTFPADLSILEYFNYGRFGEVVVGTGLDSARQFQPTALAAPDSAEAIAIRDHNATHRITIDDGVSGQNPAFLRHPAGGQFALDHTFRGGDTVTDLTGVMDDRFDLYRIQPTQDAVFTEVNSRPADVPEVGGATMTVASFNVLNYFTTLGSRGADTQEEFDRQEVKIVAALAELDADVVGLIEIENNGVAVQTLTDALNAEVGADTYDYVATGTIGTDEITTAFIYKPANVSTVGEFATLTTADDPRFDDSKNRPTLAQTFEEIATGEQVTVAVNHLKSKGSSCDSVGDPEDPWAGNCNGVRTDAAEAMVDWLAGDPTGTDVENTLIIGDLNAYDKEDPVNVFLDGGYSDLLLEHQGEFEYSYVFDGQLGYLDYALANEALAGKVTSTEAWKINADEPSVLDYDMTFKPDEQDALFEPNAFRSSDHDPVLVGLALAGISEPVVVDRTFGEDRYDTSAAIAAQFGDVDVAYLASGEVFPDALTGTAPAVRDGAPVLLTKPGVLPSAAVTALGTLQPEQVFVLGGPNTISDAVLAQVETATGATVVRIAGEDRYGTASKLALERFTAAEVDTVYVAAGEEFADSLAGGPLAGIGDDPVLLTGTGALPQATVDALVALDPARVVVLGGPVWIPDTTLTALEAYADTVERVAGEDRYETAALIADRIAPSEAAFVASGEVFPDALSGAAWAGHESSPLLLTRSETLPSATASTLVERTPARVTLFGGPDTITEAVRTAIEELLAQ